MDFIVLKEAAGQVSSGAAECRHYRRITYGDDSPSLHREGRHFVTMNETYKVDIMARTSSLRKAFFIGAIALAGLASAQQPTSKTAVSQAPPQLEQVEPGSDVPATSVQSTPRTVITEHRVNGQVVDVDVRSSGSHYNMKPNVPAGNAQINDVQNGNSIRAPTWNIMTFGGAKKKPADDTATPSSTADAPPPPMTK
jgi:hypothetical protein